MDKKQLLALRKATMLGISKCREALVQAKGNFDKAIELLRKEGQKIANKRAGMAMSQGRLFAAIHPNNQQGIMLALSSETDFAANSALFKALGERIVKAALQHNVADKTALLSTAIDNHTIQEALVQLSGQVKENIAVKAYHVLHGNFVGHYIHTGDKIGAMVSLNKVRIAKNDIASVAIDLSIQVVVSDPIAIDGNSIPEKMLNQEQEIIAAQLEKENKPTHILDKIKQQKVKKYIEENTLLPQPFFKNEKQTIAAVLAQADPGCRLVVERQ